MSKGVQIAVGATVIALLLAWVGWTNLEAGAAFTYYQDLDDFRAASAEERSAHARVHGYVALGSIERDLSRMRVSFQVQNDPPHAGGPPGELLRVIFGSLETPDLFKDGAEVVVEGRYVTAEAGGVFHADKVLAKCPSKFEAEAQKTASL